MQIMKVSKLTVRQSFNFLLLIVNKNNLVLTFFFLASGFEFTERTRGESSQLYHLNMLQNHQSAAVNSYLAGFFLDHNVTTQEPKGEAKWLMGPCDWT